MWVANFSDPSSRPRDHNITPEEEEFLSKTSIFEEFVATFTDKCLTLIEHSSREQTRHETDVGEESLNDEEITVDAAIADTFQKMMVKCSPELFDLAYNKIKRFVQGSIFEVAVSGSILGCMIKVCANIKPQQTLDFFVPHLTERIHTALDDRADAKKANDYYL